MDDQEPRLSPAYLAGKIEALEALLLAACAELPERAMYHLADAARRISDEAEADQGRSAIRDERAKGMLQVAEPFREALFSTIDEVAAGDRVRTVQPAPIRKENQLFPDKGW